MGVEYVPTVEERRVFKECNQESFWYRCKFSRHAWVSQGVTRVLLFFFLFFHLPSTAVPFSMISMALTQVLVKRGIVACTDDNNEVKCWMTQGLMLSDQFNSF